MHNSNIRRICCIYSIIYCHNYPTKKKIQACLETETGFNYSKSQIEKDLYALNNQFDIIIKYCHKNRGYFLGDSSEPHVFIFNLFEYLKLTEIKIINTLLNQCHILKTKEKY